MNIGFLSVWEIENEYYFSDTPNPYYGDDVFRPFTYFKKHAELAGHRVDIMTKMELGTVDAFVFGEYPEESNPFFLYAQKNNKPMFLISFETELAFPRSHVVSKHDHFLKIFTYNDNWVDGVRYIKLNSNTFDFSVPIRNDVKKEKLLVLVANNKHVPHPRELTAKRHRDIEWLDKNAAESFDLYGGKWEPLGLNTYRGLIKAKIDVLSRYRFVICYENTCGVYGFITEKIFDAMFAGAVPIYWGAENVQEYIPKNCFVDRRDFKSTDDLFRYISTMGDGEYQAYLDAIRNLLNRSSDSIFSLDYFAHTLLDNILDGCALLYSGFDAFPRPKNPKLLIELGNELLPINSARSIEAFREAISFADNCANVLVEAKIGLIKAFRGQKNYNEAFRLIVEMEKSHPNNFALRIERSATTVIYAMDLLGSTDNELNILYGEYQKLQGDMGFIKDEKILHLLLLRAEVARYLGHFPSAVEKYNESIELANQFPMYTDEVVRHVQAFNQQLSSFQINSK